MKEPGKLAGYWRGVLLLASPRMAVSNARNLLLGFRLLLRGRKSLAIWDTYFDAAYYRCTYQDVCRSGIWPALHYAIQGYLEKRNPSANFISTYYLAHNPDVGDAGINPLLHYAVFGISEGRNATPPRRSSAAKKRANEAFLLGHEAPPEPDGTKPLVTVVIPCFNYGPYVEEAIHSVLSETFSNLEIIVVEGGSTDGTTPAILRELERQALPLTRFLYRTESRLAGDNRNFGIAAARGRLICCLDADDLIKPPYLEVAVFLIEFCGWDIAYPSVICFGKSDTLWSLSDAVWPDIADVNQISTVALFRKSAWEAVGGFRDWGKGDAHVPEDWDFWVRLVGRGFRGASISEPLMTYRVHGAGLWDRTQSRLDYQRQTIRESSPELFAKGRRPNAAPQEPPAISWADLMEPAGSHSAILLALPYITIGGAERLFETLTRSLIGLGYKVIILTTLVLEPASPDCSASFEKITPYLYALPRLLQDREDCWEDFLRYLLIRHHVGTILNAGCDFIYTSLPSITREFREVRVVDQLFNDQVHYFSNRQYAGYIGATIVPSPVLANKLIAGGEQSGNVHVIPHGVVIEDPPAIADSFEGAGLPEGFRGKFLVSFFGRLSIEKAPADFVEIANLLRQHDEIRFLMTGDGNERAAVLSLIDHYRLKDCIHAPGFVDNVRSLMALSDVVVVPSTVDGMPLVVFEAQGQGKPVVASAVGSIPDVIADGKTGMLCRAGDVQSFADRILELWRSPELRRSIGSAASIMVRANHSAEAMTGKYLDVFDRARPRAGSPPAFGYNSR